MNSFRKYHSEYNSEYSGASTGSMYCGMYFGGGQKVCQCTDAYYTSALSCVAKLAYNVQCLDI